MKSLIFIALLVVLPQAQAFEMIGLAGADLNMMSNKPTTTVSSGGGVTYGFMGRLELGQGRIESGFLYTPTSITNSTALGNIKFSGAYWVLPVLYRFDLLPPFFSIGIGPDFAVVGSSDIAVNNTSLTSSGYDNHFGAQVSFEAAQDLGENLSVVLDTRYRYGFGTAIQIASKNVGYNFLLLALGLQKRLE